MIYSLSKALDCVENEFNGAVPSHSKRVALIAARLGRSAGLSQQERMNLAAAAALHDNGLAEYQQQTGHRGETAGAAEQTVKEEQTEKTEQEGMRMQLLLQHSSFGERNVEKLPFYQQMKGAILYHHEQADGRGPFGKRPEEIPLYARFIHMADDLDIKFDFSSVPEEKYQRICSYVLDQTGILYDAQTAELFRQTFRNASELELDLEQLENMLQEELPEVSAVYTPKEMQTFSTIFAKIIDDKSPFTCRHSLGIAQKASEMGRYYGWSEDVSAELYLAGALHDVGKLMTKSDILEKPGKLTDVEYKHIQNHAFGSYLILKDIRGMEKIAAWAYLHHEKLDGSGYPFGRTAETLSKEERLMACLDIYQALVEARPYKEGMPHEKAIGILRDMAERGQLDAKIVEDIHGCFAKTSVSR